VPTHRSPYIDRLREAYGNRALPISDQYDAAAKVIRAFGYDCPKADLMARWAFSEGYDVYCRDGRYKFELANHGGGWSVTAP
jgi:hypothetical protein